MQSIKEVIKRFATGEMVVVFDSEKRENEADLIVSIEHLTPAHVAFMSEHGRGLICAPISQQIAEQKGLTLMPSNKLDKHSTAFTVSIDSKKCKTGISAYERWLTAKELINPASSLKDFVTPGHMFPLIASKGLLLERTGHTEAAVSLCEWAGLGAGALICEMMNSDGEMYRRKDSLKFAHEHNLPYCSITDLINYQKLTFPNVKKVSSAKLPTSYGVFDIAVYQEFYSNKEHVFLSMGDYKNGPVRIHSECLTGDAFSSRTCDCGEQLNFSMDLISKEGKGAIVYLRQEGRNIGLGQKIKAYSLQQEVGLDTVDANLKLGHDADERDFHCAAWILKLEGYSQIKLLTNNPDKISGLTEHGFVVDPVHLKSTTRAENRKYLLTKASKLGHKIKVEELT